MIFEKKALVRSWDEWRELEQKTVGGDGFYHVSQPREYPVLVLEADNPSHVAHDFQSKAYIVISCDDIRKLIGRDGE